jgi:hypothetical protein
LIQARDLPPALTHSAGAPGEPASAAGAAGETLYDQVVRTGGSFWDLVRKPYLRRELGRDEVKQLVQLGYREGGRSYKGMARLFGIEDQYKKLVDFLRHHDLHVDE